LTGSAGDDLVSGGRGDDAAFLGAGDDTFVWNPGDGSDTVEGQAGVDTLLFNGANIAENIDIAANGERARFVRDVASITMDLNDVEHIDFNALGGADNIVVNDLSGTGVTQVNLDLAASGGTAADGANDTVTINGTNGDDVITLTLRNGALVISGLAAEVVIDHFDLTDTIRILGLGGDDVIQASAVGPGGPKLVLEGGDGDDVLIGSSGDDTILGNAGDDVLRGGPGNDALDGGPGDNVVIQSIATTVPGGTAAVADGANAPVAAVAAEPVSDPAQTPGPATPPETSSAPGAAASDAFLHDHFVWEDSHAAAGEGNIDVHEVQGTGSFDPMPEQAHDADGSFQFDFGADEQSTFDHADASALHAGALL
jgi:Ca2+-binding RTX toxin-like protein